MLEEVVKIKPDVILVWGRNVDFPLWRQFLRDNRQRFGKVIIAWMESHSGDDYRDFIRYSMQQDNVTFLDAPTQEELHDIDWRHASIHKALPLVTSNWIWFTEQDFFPTDEIFWEMVYSASDKAEAIGVKSGDRLHPCSLFMTVEALNKTNRFFGIVTGESDHFGQIQADIERFGINLVVINDHYKHMNGASHNFRLITEGQDANYMPDDFADYLKKCLEVNVPIDSRFSAIARGWLRKRELSGNNITTIGEGLPTPTK